MGTSSGELLSTGAHILPWGADIAASLQEGSHRVGLSLTWRPVLPGRGKVTVKGPVQAESGCTPQQQHEALGPWAVTKIDDNCNSLRE